MDETMPVTQWAEPLPRATLLASDPYTARPIRKITALLRQACPAWTYKDIPAGGHMAPLSRPDLVNPIVRSFLLSGRGAAAGRFPERESPGLRRFASEIASDGAIPANTHKFPQQLIRPAGRALLIICDAAASCGAESCRCQAALGIGSGFVPVRRFPSPDGHALAPLSPRKESGAFFLQRDAEIKRGSGEPLPRDVVLFPTIRS